MSEYDLTLIREGNRISIFGILELLLKEEMISHVLIAKLVKYISIGITN